MGSSRQAWSGKLRLRSPETGCVGWDGVEELYNWELWSTLILESENTCDANRPPPCWYVDVTARGPGGHAEAAIKSEPRHVPMRARVALRVPVLWGVGTCLETVMSLYVWKSMTGSDCEP